MKLILLKSDEIFNLIGCRAI